MTADVAAGAAATLGTDAAAAAADVAGQIFGALLGGDARDAWTAAASTALVGAGKGCEIPNFKGSYLGRFPLVLADFWTSDHLSERSQT